MGYHEIHFTISERLVREEEHRVNISDDTADIVSCEAAIKKLAHGGS